MIKRYLLSKLMILLVVFIIVVAAILPFIEPTVPPEPVVTESTPQRRSTPVIVEPSIEEVLVEREIEEIPDFSSIKSIPEKKNAFFTFLKPYIRDENSRIAKERKKIKAIARLFELYGKILAKR